MNRNLIKEQRTEDEEVQFTPAVTMRLHVRLGAANRGSHFLSTLQLNADISERISTRHQRASGAFTPLPSTICALMPGVTKARESGGEHECCLMHLPWQHFCFSTQSFTISDHVTLSLVSNSPGY